MEKKATSIYGPVYEMIRKMQTASESDLPNLMNQLFSLNEEVYAEFQSFDAEFERIRNANMELEEKLKSLDELLDKRMEATSPSDLALSRISCENIYKGYWEKLDEFSQKYLTMANYLYKLLAKDDTDFSPSVLEFGRAVENELVLKIYKGYVASLSGNTEGMIDHGSLYGELKSAVRSYTNNNGEYYIPARAMVKYLGYLSDEELQNAYNDALKNYLCDTGVDKNPISEEMFTSTADELFDKYRNTAAHPGTTMDEVEGRICREKSKKVLKKFMSAVQ